jgi:alpha-tubulin suppressor-like RCC1 family protein
MAGFTVAQPGGYSADLDALLVRRDLFNSGNLWTCGYNNYGYLGQGTSGSVNNTSSPNTVAGGGLNWQSIVNGNTTVAGIKTDGTLWTWGYNNAGQLGNGSTTNQSSPVSVIGGGTTWSQVSASFNVVFAVKTDGTLWGMGANSTGQLGNGATANSQTSPNTVAGGGTSWRQVSTSDGSATAAIKTDGTLWTWGSGTNGGLGNGSTANTSSPGTVAGGGTTWSQVAVGSYHAAAVKTDGTLWTWGYNFYGQLGSGTTTDRSSPGTTAGAGTTWRQVSTGGYYIVAIKTDGTLWTWGFGTYGVLGNGSTASTSSPNTVAGGGTTWRQVSANYYGSAGIKTDGTLWTWGRNAYGTLGDGTTTDRSSPVSVLGSGTLWKSVTIGTILGAISDLST